MKVSNPSMQTHVIRHRPGWRAVDLRELWQYRDLFYFLVWRDIKSRYAQSVLGIGWAVIQPLFLMIVFTVIFGNLLAVRSDGVPYALFSYSGLVPWTFFAGAVAGSTGSLVQNASMLKKVYFPRLVIPAAAVAAKLVDFGIALVLVFGIMAWYRTWPGPWALALPLLVVLMVLSGLGTGMWLTALAVQYRDVNYGVVFAVQLLMYASPVVYPASAVPDGLRPLYGLNPMTGVIEGFRSALIGANPMPWDLLATGTAVSVLLVVTGVFYFRRMERLFADVA